MTICWERAVPLAFHLCCFYFSAVLTVGVPFLFGVLGRMWNSTVSFLIIAFLSKLLMLFFYIKFKEKSSHDNRNFHTKRPTI